MISMEDPQGGSTTYTYDTLNRVNTLKNPQRNQFSFAYDALGRRTQLARPNSINTNYQYDSLSQLTRCCISSRRIRAQPPLWMEPRTLTMPRAIGCRAPMAEPTSRRITD